MQNGLRRAALLADSPRFVPLVLGDHFSGSVGVVPVPQHDAVAADLKLPGGVQRHGLPRFWILDFRLPKEEKQGPRGAEPGVAAGTPTPAPGLPQTEDLEQAGRALFTSVWGMMYPTVAVLLSRLSSGKPMKVTGLFSVVP